MKLKEYLHLMRRYVTLIVVATVIGGLGGFAIRTLTPTTYTASTGLFVSVATSGDAYELQMGSSFIQERIQTYVDMVETGPVLDPVIERLDLDVTPEELADHVAAHSDPRTVLISVEATAASPRQAVRVSRAVADTLVDVIDTVENPTGDAANRIRMTVSNPPTPPRAPDGLASWVWALGGIPVGFALGLGLALLRAGVDSRLRSRKDLEQITSASVLASIPDDANSREHPLITDLALDDPRGEAFRRLRTNLRFAQVDDTSSTLLVTSAQAQEGKSSTSINLAIALAQVGNRVALVDADLRQPTIAEKTGLENAAGLTTALVGTADVADLLQPWGKDELYILTAGTMPPNPAELLESRAMSTLMDRLADEFDIVIVDGPPLLPVSDSLVLAKGVGRVLFVSSIGHVRVPDVQEALTSLESIHAAYSLVLNRVPRSGVDMGGYRQRYPARSETEADRERIADSTGPDRQTSSLRRRPAAGGSGSSLRRTRRKRRPAASTPVEESASAGLSGQIWKAGGKPRPHIWPGWRDSELPSNRVPDDDFSEGSKGALAAFAETRRRT